MHYRRVLIVMFLIAALCLPVAIAQLAAGKLTGRVIADGEPLPGVQVIVSSPALPGGELARTTNAEGGYLFQSLPPGTYTVRFEMQGFATTRMSVKLSADQTRTLDAEMTEELQEEVTVTGATDDVSTSQEVASTYESDSVEKLALARTIEGAVSLAPGVSFTGPGGNPIISGAQSFTNLFLINGVVVSGTVRGQPRDLFIEDAVQETSVQTGGVSAEYGRFAGGVVNTITKSGGNEFEGSFRVNLENDDWQARTPIQEGDPNFEKQDDINEVYEATFGGRIIRDRLWFFLAGRDFETFQTEQTRSPTNFSYDAGNEETRYEGKLTAAITPNHRIIGSYFEVEDDIIGSNQFGAALDLDYVDDEASVPQESYSVNYNGFITPEFAIEAQYAERERFFEGFGGEDPSLTGGTWIDSTNPVGRYNAPVFCGVCGPEERSNDNFLVKASYFLSTDWGTHDIAAGFDTYSDIRLSNNFQSASNFSVFNTNAIVGEDDVYPVFNSNIPFDTLIVHWPILGPSKGTDFETNSYYINDRWRLNENWTFNLGLRYDENDGVDAEGKPVVDDSAWSPRLGATYDPKGDGEWLFSAYYGQYVSAIANTVADSSSAAGTPAILVFPYSGPGATPINVGLGPNDPGLQTAEQALDVLFDWFINQAGYDRNNPIDSLFSDPDGRLDPIQATIPGSTLVIGDDLGSPFATEITLGVTKRLGSRGVIRADYVHREFSDFYADRIDTGTGQTASGADRGIVINEDNQLVREYDGIQMSARYQFTERFGMGGSYTWSKLRGNIIGETTGSGPISSSVASYPELREKEWNFPEGDLGSDQRHRLRLWGFYDLISTENHNLNISVTQSYFSGTPYSATGSVNSAQFVDPAIVNQYANPPGTVGYFFSPRGAFELDSVTQTDLALNYSFFWRDFEFFVQPEVFNLWDEDAVDGVNTTVLTSENDPRLDPFNPFTEEPVFDPNLDDNGTGGLVGNWALGPDFGEPQANADFQAPRLFRISLGVRF